MRDFRELPIRIIAALGGAIFFTIFFALYFMDDSPIRMAVESIVMSLAKNIHIGSVQHPSAGQ